MNTFLCKPDDDFEYRVTELMNKLSVPVNTKGFRYLRTALILTVNEPEIIDAVTKRLYPEIAKTYSTTPACVERAIRHAIDVVWSGGELASLYMLFGYTIRFPIGKPTNSCFIATVAEHLRCGTDQYTQLMPTGAL